MSKKTKLLEDSYKKLGIDFKKIKNMYLYINIFPIYHFYHTLGTNNISSNHNNIIVFGANSQAYNIISGTNEFLFHNLYEIMLWYNYYICQYKHIKKNTKTAYAQMNLIFQEFHNITEILIRTKD